MTDLINIGGWDGMIGELSRKEWGVITSMPCDYCAKKPSNGLDRLNSSSTYTIQLSCNDLLCPRRNVYVTSEHLCPVQMSIFSYIFIDTNFELKRTNKTYFFQNKEVVIK